MRCKFCQNYQISQQVLEVEEINPGEIIRLIKRIDNNVGLLLLITNLLFGMNICLN